MKKFFMLLAALASLAFPAFCAEGPVRMKLDADTAKRMSVFISNFTELDMYDIPDASQMTPGERVYFGAGHVYINSPKQVAKSGGRLSVPSKAVSDAVKKYFGEPIASFDSPSYEYGGGSYEYAKGNVVFDAPGERAVYYARVNAAYNDGGLIIMTGDIYNTKKPADVRGQFHAYAKPHKHNNQNTWALLSLSEGPMPAPENPAPQPRVAEAKPAAPKPAAQKTVPADAAARPENKPGLYCVVGRELPILEKPLSPMPKVEFLGELEGIDGVAVYGNHVELRPSGNGWFALLSPDDGGVLGYVPDEGLEIVPDYERTGGEYFFVGRDAPALSLLPRGGENLSLSGYGYSLAKGEAVKSVGSLSEGGSKWLLLEFGTDYAGGSGGVGARYAWSPAENFTALRSYRPDNSQAAENLIPEKMRYGVSPLTPGDGYDPDHKGGADKLDFLPVSGGLRQSVAERGFEAGPAWKIDGNIFADELADYYAYSGDHQADFITADMFLHAFHLIFSHALQKFERTYLAPSLKESLTLALSALSEEGAGVVDDRGKIYDAARDMLVVPIVLMSEKPGEQRGLSPQVVAEVKMIMAADGVGESPVTGGKIDYSLFKPRGHYTMSPELGSYFRAMSWLGSAEIELFDGGGAPSARGLGVAALVSLALDAQGVAWGDFEAPVNFLVGAPGTGGSEIFRALAKKHYGSLAGAMEKLMDASAASAFGDAIKAAVPGPLMQSSPGGDAGLGDSGARSPVFRVSSKRFTYDAYVFNMLTSPRVGTDENPRNLPEGTDVMAVLGSRAAEGLAARNSGVKGYAENMKKLKAGVDEYLANDGTVYSAWIAALKAGFADSGSDQFFYNSPAWQWKKLSTQSASWAELKHDTILYAEQSGAEMGGGGDYAADPFAPPYPRGYVEPDPQIFGALLSATAKLTDFIDKFGMEPDTEDYQTEGRPYASKLEEFAGLLATARSIAEKEAGGKEITIDDYVSIKQLARSFNAGLLLPGERTDDTEQLRMALVADAASDYFGGGVLEIATGRPQRLYVFVNDASGGARITRGYIYSYYEFERSLSDGRLTDEEWKKTVYGASRPDGLEKYRPGWYGELLK